jgi:P27 family predicted phage terminase small subunit
MDEAPYAAPAPPSHLHATGAGAWTRLATAMELADADDLEVLRLACEAMDRAAQARRVLREQGLTVVDKKGAPHAHPAAAIEARSATRAAALVKQLQSARLSFERLHLAQRRAERAEQPRRRDRRGGGVRR